jgi:hypothetical protein
MTAAEESGKVTTDNPYVDRIEGDVLLYTAQGREGDQALAGRNKRLLDQYAVPVPYYGFINVGRQTYRFLGLLELLRHYQETQADIRGTLRKVWLFEFRIHSEPEIIPIEQAAEISASVLARSRKMTPALDLEREVGSLPGGEPEPDTTELNTDIEAVRSNLLQIDPRRFEQLIKDLMVRSGFVQVSTTRYSGDGGIDINAFVADADEFFAGTHVQAQVKRWRHSVGSVEINGFRGALNTTAKGVFITTSHFTKAAIAEARHEAKLCISLIDGGRLSSLVVRNKIDVGQYR